MENTKISWATHSFSPWIGCSQVHVGCQHCYAAAMSGRLGVTWGPNGTRRRTAASTWKQVENWNRKAACNCGAAGAGPGECQWCAGGCVRPRVFPSLCDPFEDWGGHVETPKAAVSMSDVRRDFFALIDRCQNLDFLLLTKRPKNIQRMVPMRWAPRDYWGGNARQPRNVWLLYSASDQESFDAGWYEIWYCRDLVPVWGFSIEPLIGPIEMGLLNLNVEHRPSWVIVGGESGPRARPMRLEWLESIAEQCAAAGVPLFVKQDAGPKAGQQGRISDRFWSIKQFPKG